MERKIGEIFEYNGEWYQCLEEKTCTCFGCNFRDYNCDDISLKEVKGSCQSDVRSDGISVIFKKLEKVGEPYVLEDKKFQKYKVFKTPYIYHKIDCSWQSFADPYYISLEIKQNKEDMEEKKLIELLSEKVHNAWMKEKEAQGFSYGKDYDKEKKKHPDMLPYNELKEEVKEYDRATVRAVLQAQKELQSKYNYNNLKPFDIQKAREGKPVCTRDGRKVRVLCYDFKQNEEYPILVAVEDKDGKERAMLYSNGGISEIYKSRNYELAMLLEKKERWVNVYKGGLLNTKYYSSKEEAVSKASQTDYIDTVKIEWEE